MENINLIDTFSEFKELKNIIDNPDENKIYVGFNELLSSQEFDVENVNWQQEEYASLQEFSAMTKIRYNSGAQEALITKTGENSIHVKIKTPKFAITPGAS